MQPQITKRKITGFIKYVLKLKFCLLKLPSIYVHYAVSIEIAHLGAWIFQVIDVVKMCMKLLH